MPINRRRQRFLFPAIVAILLLPSALIFYGGFLGFFRRLRKGEGLFIDTIAGQLIIREKILARNRLLRRIVFLFFSLAIRIHQAGSLRQALWTLRYTIRTGGIDFLRSRLAATVPSIDGSLTNIKHRKGIPPVLPEEVSRRILVSDYRIPRIDGSAGERATVGILRDLCRMCYEVVFLPTDMTPSPKYEAPLRALGIQIVTREAGYNDPVSYVISHGNEFGVFYLIRAEVAELILPASCRVAPDARNIFHAPDLHFLRELREAEIRNDPLIRQRALQTRNRELAVMRHADFVVVVSSAEAPILKGLLPNTPIAVFPVLYAPVIESPAPYANRKNIFFLGGFGHSPNVNAVHWFAAEIWPHIRKTLPDLEFYIIGADAPESVAALGKQPGIRFMGFVADLESMLQTLRIGVAPLLFGAGIKGKVAMAMGSGVACVCTGIAAEGMDIENDVHALVEDDPTRFARAVVSLYQDEEKWNKLSRNGQLLTQNKFSDTANLRSLLKVLNQANALPIKLFCNHCQTLDPVPVPVPGDIVDVSVIVPVFNKWEFTRACLTSILRTSIGSGIAYEVILADDGSADETTHATQFFPGLRIVKTPENMGFLRNCNNAAKHALGRYILLLNNDTVVLPGWLASLYETIETDSSIAIVGSKLVYPDGTIQEAGGILFNDGSGCSVGRGANRFTEVFNIQREVDYVSGTSILIRRQFWEEIAGFDQRYRNAYCEDSDLAMTARSKGMRVVYEPRSEVIHFEHQSYQDQLSSDTHDMLQKHNQPILFDKWKDVFLNDHLPSCSWWLGAASAERALPPSAVLRRKSGSLNILYFSPFPSHPCKHGNQATIQQFAKRFQLMGHKVHFALLQSSLFNSQDAQNMSTAWDSFDILQNSHPLAYSGLPIPFDGWYEEGQGECVRFLCARYEIDVVFCSYIFQSKILEYLPNYILKVIDTHDKMGNRYEMLQKNGQPPEFFSCTYEEEGIYLRRADVVVARREEEARYFDSVTGRETAIVVPHVEEPHFLERKFGALHHVGMLASANRINLAIARGCIEAIDQRLSGQAYPFTLHIAGQLKEMIEALPRNERTIYKRPWVRLRGFIPDIAEFYSAMDLVVSPVTMGTGINVKTVQAMAYGMPLLSTACGSKGIETGDAMHSHQNLESLVEALMSLVDNPEELNRLATLSRSRYQVFYDYCLRGFDSIFSHPKLYKDI